MVWKNLLYVLRFLKLIGVNTTVELDGLQTDPLLGDDRNDVVATHHLATLLPHVVNAKVNVWHTCDNTAVLTVVTILEKNF